MKALPAFLLGILCLAVVIALAGYVSVANGLVPANADGPNLPGERWAAQTALKATLKRAAQDAASPPPVTDADLLAGVKLYGANCIVCHGTSTGVATNIARGVYQRPPRFSRPRAFAHDEPGAIYWQIQHGIRWTAMPSFGKALNDQQIWQLTLLLKNLDTLPPQVAQAWQSLQEPIGLATATPLPPPPSPAAR